MLRTRRARLVELELLFLPSLLILGGLFLVLTMNRGQVAWHWDDAETSIAFIVAFMMVHLYLVLRGFRGDQLLLPAVAMLSALGLVLIQRLAPPLHAAYPNLYPADLPLRQTVWVFLGVFALVATVARFEWIERLRRYKYTVALLGLLAMAGLMVPGLGATINGAKLWYRLGPLSFQPSELFKVILVFFFAAYLDERRDLLAAEYRLGPFNLPPLPYLAPMLVMWGVSMMGIVLLRDLGSALLFYGIFLAMLYALTGRALYVWVLGAFFLVGAYFSYQMFGHVQVRVEGWLHPWYDYYGYFHYPGTYQIGQSLFALASGGVFGSGLGAGSPTLIPAVHTDMIFSAIGEEMGLMGTIGVLGIYMVIVFRGFYIALRARQGFNQLLGVGLTTIFGLQTIIIVAGDTKLLPLTGITLPFVAYGGSSILMNFIMIGMLLGISGMERTGTLE